MIFLAATVLRYVVHLQSFGAVVGTGAALSPPSSSVQVTVDGDAATSAERSFVSSQRLDFKPGERVDFRFESAELGAYCICVHNHNYN